jgi:hypothetical protein
VLTPAPIIQGSCNSSAAKLNYHNLLLTLVVPNTGLFSIFEFLENSSRDCKAENKICLTAESYAAQCLSFWLNPETRILQNFKNSGVIFSSFFFNTANGLFKPDKKKLSVSVKRAN